VFSGFDDKRIFAPNLFYSKALEVMLVVTRQAEVKPGGFFRIFISNISKMFPKSSFLSKSS